MKVSIFHNVNRDHFSGYRPGHALVRVFEAYVPDRMAPHQAAEKMFEIGNAPEEYLSGEALELAPGVPGRRELRSVSVGDVVAAGEVPLACASCGWEIVAPARSARFTRPVTGLCRCGVRT